MPDNDILTRAEEIKAALRCCPNAQCWSCPCGGGTEEQYGACSRLGPDAAALIEALEAKVKELEAKAPAWISVEERFPEDDGSVLVRCTDGNYHVALYYFWHWIYGAEAEVAGTVTHWMPLPETPEEGAT